MMDCYIFIKMQSSHRRSLESELLRQSQQQGVGTAQRSARLWFEFVFEYVSFQATLAPFSSRAFGNCHNACWI